MWKKYKPSDILSYALLLAIVSIGYSLITGKVKTADDLIFTGGASFVIITILVVVFLFLLNISRVIFKKGNKRKDKSD